jgi:hypothetical protein
LQQRIANAASMDVIKLSQTEAAAPCTCTPALPPANGPHPSAAAPADALVRHSRRFLGDGITFGVMRHTFMRQFCAGEDEEDIMPTINMLRANGIRAIIDYAAEDDSPAAAPPKQQQHSTQQQQQQEPSSSAAATEGSGSSVEAVSADAAAGSWEPAPNLVAVGRQYSYENEATCDKHVQVGFARFTLCARRFVKHHIHHRPSSSVPVRHEQYDCACYLFLALGTRM